jgi:hypothetical protein
VKVFPKAGELLLVDGILTVYLADALELAGKKHKTVAVSGPKWQADNQVVVFGGSSPIMTDFFLLSKKLNEGKHFLYDNKDCLFLGDALRMTLFH